MLLAAARRELGIDRTLSVTPTSAVSPSAPVSLTAPASRDCLQSARRLAWAASTLAVPGPVVEFDDGIIRFDRDAAERSGHL